MAHDIINDQTKFRFLTKHFYQKTFLVLLPQLRKHFPNLSFDDEVSLLVLWNAGLVDND